VDVVLIIGSEDSINVIEQAPRALAAHVFGPLSEEDVIVHIYVHVIDALLYLSFAKPVEVCFEFAFFSG
jgi:hypothetical protein